MHAAAATATRPPLRPFEVLRILMEGEAYGMLLRAFHIGCSRMLRGPGERPDSMARACQAARRAAPQVALAYRRQLALHLSGRAPAVAPGQGMPDWLPDALRRACDRQLQKLRLLLTERGQGEDAGLLQPQCVARALWEAALAQWRDARSAEAFLRLSLPGLRDLLAVACARYHHTLDALPRTRPGESDPPLPATQDSRRRAGARIPPARPRSVDVFCAREHPHALWFAHNLAEYFARESGLQVHLYLPRGSIFGDVFRLFDRPEDLPPRLALREFHSFAGHPAGDIAVALLGSRLPPDYLAHRRRCGARPWVYRVHGLGVDAPPTQPTDLLSYEVPLPHGFLPAGHVKPHMNLLGMRQRLHGQPALFARYLQGAGGLRPPLPDEITVLADFEDPRALQRWMAAWRGSPAIVRVLVPAPRLAAAQEAGLAPPAGAHPETCAGPLTLSALGLNAIQQMDPILACCDLALTDDASVAVRSLAAGVPLLAPLHAAALGPMGLGPTHATALACDRGARDPRILLLDGILMDWNAGLDLGPAWLDLLAALPALDSFAAGVADAFWAAPHVADAALALA